VKIETKEKMLIEWISQQVWKCSWDYNLLIASRPDGLCRDELLLIPFKSDLTIRICSWDYNLLVARPPPRKRGYLLTLTNCP